MVAERPVLSLRTVEGNLKLATEMLISIEASYVDRMRFFGFAAVTTVCDLSPGRFVHAMHMCIVSSVVRPGA